MELKWVAVDFIYNTISIRNTVTEYSNNGKLVSEGKDRAKTKIV